MRIKPPRAFRHTLDTGSVADASRVMHLSPPAVSRLMHACATRAVEALINGARYQVDLDRSPDGPSLRTTFPRFLELA
jgi:hypothetical protein